MLPNVPLCDITVSCSDQLPSRSRIIRQDTSSKRANGSEAMHKQKKVKIEEESEEEDFYEEPEISEYEKMVQRNKEEQMAFLEALKIDEAKADLKVAIDKAIREKPKKVAVTKTVKKPSIVLPPRRSTRLSRSKLSEEEMTREFLEAEAEVEEEKSLPHTFSFQDAMQEKDLFSNFMYDFTYLDLKKEENCNYQSCFKNMAITESSIAKVVNGRITALAVHPDPEKIIVCAGSKYGKLGFWNVDSDNSPYEMTPHLQGITNVQFNPLRRNNVITSSYEGTVRCGDLEKMVFKGLYDISEETSCTHFDFLCETTLLVALKNGQVAIVDDRDNIRVEKKHRCHDYPLKTVSVHPVKTSYFFTACNKGIMGLWDLRKLQKQPIIEVKNQHKRSVNSAFFSPVTGDAILTTSQDDTVCIFGSSQLSNDICLKKSIKHNNHTGRWLSLFKATWLPCSEDAFVIGSMDFPRRIQIFSSQMDNIYNFKDENLNSITSLNAFHPSRPVLAGANSSGKVYIFK